VSVFPVLTRYAWFSKEYNQETGKHFGFRQEPGGVHLSKTMMLGDLEQALAEGEATDLHALGRAIVDENVLNKPTCSARRLALARLSTLYGIGHSLPLQAAMLGLWKRSRDGRPLLALLCSLAREPLFRDTAGPILAAPIGALLRWPDFAQPLVEFYSTRYSPKMMKSLAQNCASSWTQSGHLRGKVSKRRARAEPSPEAAAYAALLGSVDGFGGPALLASPWMKVLDRPETELVGLLRRAEAAGLALVRAGGGVIQIAVCRPLARVLGMPILGEHRGSNGETQIRE
jgi:hypothetical protein